MAAHGLRRRTVVAAALAAALTAASAGALAQQRAPVPISALERNSTAATQGVVDRITDEDEFRLRDESGSIQVYVGPNWVPVEVGERITVRGFVDGGLIKELYAREIVREDGSVVRFDLRYE